MSYQTAISGLDWQMVPSGMMIPAGGVAAMQLYEQGMGAICAGNNVGAITADISGGDYTGSISDIVYDVIVISGAISTNRTVNLYYNSGTKNGVKPYTVLCYANASSGGPYTVTLATGVGSSLVISVPASGSTLYGTPTMLCIYVDSNGNVCSVGSIVESGSNTNGSWIKFADGAMECWGSTARTATSVLIVATIYRSPAAVIAYPAAFIAVVYPQFNGSDDSLSNTWPGSTDTETVNGCNSYAWSSSATASTILRWHAIGRWK